MNFFNGAEDPEEQPLLERQNYSGPANRERFQQNQEREAWAIVQAHQCALILVVVLVVLLWSVWWMFYFTGWSIWYNHGDEPCDQPLANWLLAMLSFPLISIWLNLVKYRVLRGFVIFLTTCELFSGAYIFSQSETCADTSPDLYTFVRQYLIFLMVWLIFWEIMTCLFIGFVVYGMMNGWFDEINGASPETINRIETVGYDPSLFAEEGRGDDSRPAPECCICTEAFDASHVIKRTSCQHFFHEECLQKWLRASTSCPLCRNDLEASTPGGRSQSAVKDPAPTRAALFTLGAGAAVPPGNAPGPQNRQAYVSGHMAGTVR